MSNRVYRSTIFRNLWKRRRLAAGHFPAADRLPIGCPDAFHWQRVTGWRPGCSVECALRDYRLQWTAFFSPFPLVT